MVGRLPAFDTDLAIMSWRKGSRPRLTDLAGQKVRPSAASGLDVLSRGLLMGIRDNFARLKKAGAVVLGVSPDTVSKHVKFKQKYDLPFTLVSDPDKTVCGLYDVWKEKSMYGRKYMGVELSTFLIDEHGKIKALWRKVKVPGHVEEVLEALT